MLEDLVCCACIWAEAFRFKRNYEQLIIHNFWKVWMFVKSYWALNGFIWEGNWPLLSPHACTFHLLVSRSLSASDPHLSRILTQTKWKVNILPHRWSSVLKLNQDFVSLVFSHSGWQFLGKLHVITSQTIICTATVCDCMMWLKCALSVVRITMGIQRRHLLFL